MSLQNIYNFNTAKSDFFCFSRSRITSIVISTGGRITDSGTKGNILLCSFECLFFLEYVQFKDVQENCNTSSLAISALQRLINITNTAPYLWVAVLLSHLILIM